MAGARRQHPDTRPAPDADDEPRRWKRRVPWFDKFGNSLTVYAGLASTGPRSGRRLNRHRPFSDGLGEHRVPSEHRGWRRTDRNLLNHFRLHVRGSNWPAHPVRRRIDAERLSRAPCAARVSMPARQIAYVPLAPRERRSPCRLTHLAPSVSLVQTAMDSTGFYWLDTAGNISMCPIPPAACPTGGVPVVRGAAGMGRRADSRSRTGASSSSWGRPPAERLRGRARALRRRKRALLLLAGKR